MGFYINSGNERFTSIRNSYYVDKSGLIDILNQSIGTEHNLFCISRPRRFGKSTAIKMISAYYDCSCDSHKLFDDLEIAKTENYLKHLNQYNVVILDMATLKQHAIYSYGDAIFIDKYIIKIIENELVSDYPELKEYDDINEKLRRYAYLSSRKFVFVIDEWDVCIREDPHNYELHKKYFKLLLSLFKNDYDGAIACTYMTGILPIKTDGSQSSLSNFRCYSIIDPGSFAKYTGFTEEEVKKICIDQNMDFDKMKKWYNGYYLPNIGPVYNPFAVIEACHFKDYRSYWVETSSAEALISYVNMNYDGLQKSVASLTSGQSIYVDIKNIKMT